MDLFIKYDFGLEGVFWGGLLIILIYLIFRRIKIKKIEDFEDRDN
jgi:hypothetical protein